MEPLESRDWTLLAVALADGQPLTPVQLQKILFLFGKRLAGNVVGEGYYEFFPYNYGPFCPDVYADACRLAEDGLVTISRPPGCDYSQYAGTAQGFKRGQSLLAQLPAEAAGLAERIVRWACAQSFRSLVSAIYRQYPEFRVNSVFSG
jgi:hypothetical protein